MTKTYVWRDARLQPCDAAEAPPGPVQVADSWRQVQGRVRRLGLHRARFIGSVAQVAPERSADAGAFFDAAAQAVPVEDEWFPRVRLVGGELIADVRPGPPRRAEVVVRVLACGDPRSMPLVKGPDLALAGDLIAAARDVGSDEVLIRDARGRVLEAGYAALVWWDGEDLCVPARSLPVLPSITRRIVEEQVVALGGRVRPVEARVEDLDGREAWLLNAYQGLRVVTGWRDAPIQAGSASRAASWREWLESR